MSICTLRHTTAIVTTGAALAVIIAGFFVPGGLQGTSTASASLPRSSGHNSSSHYKTRPGIRVILASIYETAPLTANPSSKINLEAWIPLSNFDELAPIARKGDFLGPSALGQNSAAARTISYTETLAAHDTIIYRLAD
jgi:hypothetical protein